MMPVCDVSGQDAFHRFSVEADEDAAQERVKICDVLGFNDTKNPRYDNAHDKKSTIQYSSQY